MKKIVMLIVVSILGGLFFVWLLIDVLGPKAPYAPTVQVNGVLYYDTGCVNESDVRSEEFDGRITSYVESHKLPTKDNQANFDVGYDHKYQLGAIEGTIEVYIEKYDHWLIFANKEVHDKYNFKSVVNIDHK